MMGRPIRAKNIKEYGNNCNAAEKTLLMLIKTLIIQMLNPSHHQHIKKNRNRGLEIVYRLWHKNPKSHKILFGTFYKNFHILLRANNCF